jgi:hypothetical protein
LITRDPGDRQRAAEEGGIAGPVDPAAVTHLGEQRLRHVEEAQQLLVPALTVNVVEERPRGVGHVRGVHPPARQSPEQERVDGAAGKLAAPGTRTCSRDVIEQPGELGGGEVGIEQQPGSRSHEILRPLSPKPCAGLRGAPILPDDRPVDRPPRGAVPHDDRLTLVGDAERGDLCRRRSIALEAFPDHRERVAPDVLGVVLHPGRRRIVLRQLAPREGHGVRVCVERDGACRGRALIDRKQQWGWHGGAFSRTAAAGAR